MQQKYIELYTKPLEIHKIYRNDTSSRPAGQPASSRPAGQPASSRPAGQLQAGRPAQNLHFCLV